MATYGDGVYGLGTYGAGDSGDPTPSVNARFTGTGALTALVQAVPAVSASFTGTGALTATATKVPQVSVNARFTGSGALFADAFAVTDPNPSIRTVRWAMRDTVTDELWTMPINPDSASSPLPTRTMRFGYGSRKDRRVTTFATRGEPTAWEFGGVIRTRSHYDQLVAWAEKTVAVEVTDHLGRTFLVFIEEFNPVDRRPTPRTSWRLRYTMKARILEQIR